jgi:hypothetical protein
MSTSHVRSLFNGWRAFAGILIGMAGIFNFIDGIVTLRDPHYFTYHPATNQVVFGDLTAWGWTVLIIGIVQFLVAFGVLFWAARWAAITGIVIASFSAIAQLLNLGVDPLWSITVIVLDVLVIKALAVNVLGQSFIDPVGP